MHFIGNILFCFVSLINWQDIISLISPSNNYHRYNHRYPRPRRHYGSQDNHNSPYRTRNDLDYYYNTIVPKDDLLIDDLNAHHPWFYLHGNQNPEAYPTYYDYLLSVFGNINSPLSSYELLQTRTRRPKPVGKLCPLHRVRKKQTQISESTTDFRRKYQNANINENLPLGANREFLNALDKFDRAIYNATFAKLSTKSFAQSGLLAYLLLVALAAAVDDEARAQIEEHCVPPLTDEERISILQRVIDSLPQTSEELKFRWASRLVLAPGTPLPAGFLAGPARALRLRVHFYNQTYTPEDKAALLNNMVEQDSGGALRDTFDVDEVAEGGGGGGGALLSTLYVRARWRAAPTLLNGTREFRRLHAAPAPAPAPAARHVRMLRVNDRARYARLHQWGAEGVEISYATEGLTLLLVVPREASLAHTARRLAAEGVSAVAARLRPMRVAVTMPLYTLRMALLLPNKLKSLGVSKLVSAEGREGSRLWLSLAVHRVMFWSEAGRHAFKDDGIEWDDVPDQEMMVDCPYIFFVQWKNVTLLTGNFLL